MSIVSFIVFGTLCEFIIPNSNTKKYINLVIGTILIITTGNFFTKNLNHTKYPNENNITFELSNIFNNDSLVNPKNEINITSFGSNGQLNMQTSFDKIYKINLQNKIKEMIQEKDGILIKNVDVILEQKSSNLPEISQITINLKDPKIDKENSDAIIHTLKNEFEINEKKIRFGH